MAQPNVVRSEEIDAAMKDAATCPFCGASQGTVPDIRFVRFEMRLRGEKFYYVSCWICGGRGPEMETPLLAIKRWNDRQFQTWQPLGAHSFQLPGVQKYGTLLIHEGGQHISLIDYIEQEVMPPDGIVSKIDVDLGHFRVADLRGPDAGRK